MLEKVSSPEITPEVTVAVCTRKRRELIQKCLASLLCQETSVLYEIIVTENDFERESWPIIEPFSAEAEKKGISLRYFCEPRQNIALARNLCIRESRAPFLLFIDDDEWAATDWIEKMMEIQRRVDADVVQGTCVPIFADGFPERLKKYCSMYRYEACEEEIVRVPGVATNTTLYRLSALAEREEPLNPKYGTSGGSDFELSLYLDGRGKTQYKTCLAKVYEFQPISRGRLRFFLERDFREALNTFRAIRSHCGRVGAIRFVLFRLRGHFVTVLKAFVTLPIHPIGSFIHMLESLTCTLGLFAALLGFRKRGYF
ncbi:MAG: glycosyltransferase family 2 protein [Planctomycetia bacterium]|nr:glycosyltransferase family 2 protein [Planctomycetia bacterium]